MRNLFYYRLHIALCIMVLAGLCNCVWFLLSDTLLWKMFFLGTVVFSIKGSYNLLTHVRLINERHKRANQELPEGAIVFEDIAKP